MDDDNTSNSPDCANIDYVYNTINNVKIYPRFHFVEFMGEQFECDHPNENYDARLFASALIDSMNIILGNFAVNSNGGSQLPNGGESKIRFFSTPDVFECSNIFFWGSYDDYVNGTAGNGDFDIIFTEKGKLKYDDDGNVIDTIYGSSGQATIGGSNLRLYNVHQDIFFENKDIETVADTYDGIGIHELFHVFRLPHSWDCSANCGDLDRIVECGGSPPSGVPCGSICESFAADGVWGNSNNTMGYNSDQDALTNCQYAKAFSGIIEERPWKFIEFNEAYECNDIIIDQSYEPTTTWGCDKYLECNIEVQAGRELIFDNIKVEMGTGTAIILHPGSRLIIRGGFLIGAENEKGFWNGITILKGDGTPQNDDPYLDIQSYSSTKAATLIFEEGMTSSGFLSPAILQDADIGVSVGDGLSKYSGGGLIYAERSKIKNCNIGIDFKPYNHYNKSTFLRPSSFNNTKDIVIHRNFGFTFDGIIFEGASVENSYGLILYNSTIDKLLAPKFSSRHIGITILGSHPSMPGFTIGERNQFNNQTTFRVCDIGIAFTSQGFGNLANVNIMDTKFDFCETGILAWGESEYNVYNNVFNATGTESGAVFGVGLSAGSATNDCYCNIITNTSSTIECLGFGFAGNNQNTSIFSNTFSFTANADECIKTEQEGDIFAIQATQFDPSAFPTNTNLPAANDFKDSDRDLLIDDLGSNITYLTPEDNSLIQYFPNFVSNYTELQSIRNPQSCDSIVNQIHEPHTLVPSDGMPPIVKDEWPDPIGDPVLQEEYIDFIHLLPPGTVDEDDRDREIARAEYAQYNAVVAASATPAYLSTLQQLSGNIWKRLEYGYYMENEDYNSAANIIQNMSIEHSSDNDFIFLQDIVLDKLMHEANQVQVPFAISSTEDIRIKSIIDSANIMSGYASSLYFDLYRLVLLPANTIRSTPRRSIDQRASTFLIYPNPSNNILHFEGLNNNEKVEIYDLNNNKIMSFRHKQNAANDISSLISGIYFVKSGSHPIIQFIKI